MSARSILAQVPLFAGLSREQLEALARSLRSRQYPRGSIVFHQGDPGTTLYIIEDGEVKLTVLSSEGKEIVLALLGVGGFFGELTLIDGEPRSATAVAKTACQLLALERDHLLRFLEDHPRAGMGLMAALSRRLRRTTEQVQDAAFLDGPTRLAKALLELTEARGRPGPDGVVRAPRLTQDDLAEIVGGTRESINRWLRIFAQQGLVRRQRGFVTILQPEGLRKHLS